MDESGAGRAGGLAHKSETPAVICMDGDVIAACAANRLPGRIPSLSNAQPPQSPRSNRVRFP